MDIRDIPSPQPSPTKIIIILFKFLAWERGQIEMSLKICALSKNDKDINGVTMNKGLIILAGLIMLSFNACLDS